MEHTSKTDLAVSVILTAGIILTAAIPKRCQIPTLFGSSWSWSVLSVLLSFVLIANVCRILFRGHRIHPVIRGIFIILGLLAFLRLFQVTSSVQSNTVSKKEAVYETRIQPLPAEGPSGAVVKTGAMNVAGGTMLSAAPDGPYSVTSGAAGKN